MGFKVGLYNFLNSNRYAFGFVLPLAREAVKLYLYLLIPLLVVMLALNLLNSKGLLGNLTSPPPSYLSILDAPSCAPRASRASR